MTKILIALAALSAFSTVSVFADETAKTETHHVKKMKKNKKGEKKTEEKTETKTETSPSADAPANK